MIAYSAFDGTPDHQFTVSLAVLGGWPRNPSAATYRYLTEMAVQKFGPHRRVTHKVDHARRLVTVYVYLDHGPTAGATP